MPNIEIKARYRDLSVARSIAAQLQARPLWKDVQTDTYFQTRAGKLKLRESGINGAELLPYIKVNSQGTKRSDYAKIPVDAPALAKTLLNEILGQKFAVRKEREVFLIDNVRVHLDEVEGLGGFIEFEAVFSDDRKEIEDLERQKVQELVRAFGIEPADLMDGSYPDLLLRKQPARHFDEVYRHHAADYDELVEHEDFLKRLPQALDEIVDLGGKTVLELGSGTGRITRLLAARAKQVLAFDSSQAMLDVAQKKLSSMCQRNWRLGIADHRHLPLPDQSVDACVAGWTLAHLIDWHPTSWTQELEATLGEIGRVLRPGGTVILIETLGTGRENPEPPTQALAEYFSVLENRFGYIRKSIRTDYRFESIEQAQRLVRFFFGDSLANTVRKKGLLELPECTGIWWRR